MKEEVEVVVFTGVLSVSGDTSGALPTDGEGWTGGDRDLGLLCDSRLGTLGEMFISACGVLLSLLTLVFCSRSLSLGGNVRGKEERGGGGDGGGDGGGEGGGEDGRKTSSCSCNNKEAGPSPRGGAPAATGDEESSVIVVSNTSPESESAFSLNVPLDGTLVFRRGLSRVWWASLGLDSASGSSCTCCRLGGGAGGVGRPPP